MHEMSLMLNVLEILQDTAQTQGITRIQWVQLEIGALSGVEAEAMRFCFDAVCKDTLADGAILEILHTPGRGECSQCGQTVNIESRHDGCPNCGHFQLQLTAGDSMRVKQFEGS